MNNFEIIKVVAEDLKYLMDEWDQEVSDTSLRNTSTTLRRLISDDDLGKAWRLLGLAKEPIINAISLDELLGTIKLVHINQAFAGGAVYNNIQIKDIFEYNPGVTHDEIMQNYERKRNIAPKLFKLSEYRRSPCIILQGEKISRRELILYVSNKLGGAHFDPKRNDKKERERKFLLLDNYRDDYKLAGKDSVYFELLSIGQSIVKSSDIKVFLDRSKHALV